MKKRRILTVLLLCLTSIGFAACQPSGGDNSTYQLAEVTRGELIVSVSGGGNISASQETTLNFSTSGTIDKVFVSESDKVTKGEELAKLDTAPLELSLLQTQIVLRTAQYNLDIAKRNLKEAEHNLGTVEMQFYALLLPYETLKLARETVRIAEDNVKTAEMQVEAAEQSLKEAQKRLDMASLTAPFGGVVASINNSEGDIVLATSPVIHLVNLDSLELTAGIDEIDIPSVKLGQKAVISLDALPDLQLEGTVEFIDPLPRMQTGLVTYDITITFDTSENSGLMVGMSATVDIIIDERSEVLLVPNRAIKQDDSGEPVVKVMFDEQVEERQVVTGITDGLLTEIVSGLDEGETVIIELRAKQETSTTGGFFFGG